MRLIQSIDNISWTIHESNGIFVLVVWQGDGCDQIHSSKHNTLDKARGDLLAWFAGVLNGTITIPEPSDEI